MGEPDFDKASVTASIKKLLDTEDLQILSEKKLRRLIEKGLDYDELSLDQSEGKKFVKQELVRLLAEKENEGNDSEESEPVASPKPKTKPRAKATPKKSAPASKAKKQKAPLEDASEVESVPEVTPKKKQPAKKSTIASRKPKKKDSSEEQVSDSDSAKSDSPEEESEADFQHEKSPVKAKADRKAKRELPESDTDSPPKEGFQVKPSQAKRPKTESQGVNDVLESEFIVSSVEVSGLSSLEDSGEKKKRAPKKKAGGKRTSAKDSAKFSDKVLNKIKQLKVYIGKCGVRKNWKSVLGDLGPRQQIKALTTILEDLGMEGRPTIEKCKVIARQQELKRETESLDLSNIITEERRPRRARPSINYSKFDAPSPVESEAQSESEPEAESEVEWDKDASSGNEAPAKKRRSQHIVSDSEEEIDVASPEKDTSNHSDSETRPLVSDDETKPHLESAESSANLDAVPLADNDEPTEILPLTKKPGPIEAVSLEKGDQPITDTLKVQSQPPSPKLDALESSDIPNASTDAKPKSSSPPTIKQITPPLETLHKQTLDTLMFSDSE